ncbi:hypothetical protein AVEN_191214-1 [Araneus ventricosus]|uniref:Uncharacterized protein n=1 Tax=Araneus ventricosus TaxID=182803 RepID=A0A4Y2WUB0_ARAVE|nr:hypothetical protein AVEN_191214-1 [Araneus ventricosus]
MWRLKLKFHFVATLQREGLEVMGDVMLYPPTDETYSVLRNRLPTRKNIPSTERIKPSSHNQAAYPIITLQTLYSQYLGPSPTVPSIRIETQIAYNQPDNGAA